MSRPRLGDPYRTKLSRELDTLRSIVIVVLCSNDVGRSLFVLDPVDHGSEHCMGQKVNLSFNSPSILHTIMLGMRGMLG